MNCNFLFLSKLIFSLGEGGTVENAWAGQFPSVVRKKIIKTCTKFADLFQIISNYFQVYIMSSNKILCGGTIVSPRWVATSARCMEQFRLHF